MKTAFDSFMYAIGQTDVVKGTGVWSFLEINREGEGDQSQLDGNSCSVTLAIRFKELFLIGAWRSPRY